MAAPPGVMCGDNLFVEQGEQILTEALTAIRPFHPHVFIAGPAFNSGRYDLACARLSVAVQEQLSVPALTGMHTENPGLDCCRQQVYVVPTAASAAGMQAALTQLARLGTKLAQGQPLGPAAEEGYIPRGVRLNAVVEQPASVRAVDMLLAKLNGAPYETELVLETFDVVIRAGRFHHPFGDPSRTPEGEKEWRLRVVRAALAALQTPVQQPTVFDVEDIVVR